MRFSISRQLRMYHSDMDVLFSYFLTRFATDRSFFGMTMRFFWLVADGITHEHVAFFRTLVDYFSVPHEDGYTCDFQFFVSCVCIIPTWMFSFHIFLTRFATDTSFLQYIWSMIRVTLSLIRATLFQLFTFCLPIHLNTERESSGKKERW